MSKPSLRKKGVSALITLILLGVMIAYPFIVYRYIEVLSPGWFAGLLFIAFTLRFLVVARRQQYSDFMLLILVSIFCVCVVIFESEQLLKFYPVLMNVGMGLMFLTSLKDEKCLIEKFASAGGKTPPPQAYQYLRTLNLLWGILLLVNGAVSAYTAWYTSLSTWALYNGFYAYLLLFSFAIGEWIYRAYYKKKHKIVDE